MKAEPVDFVEDPADAAISAAHQHAEWLKVLE